MEQSSSSSPVQSPSLAGKWDVVNKRRRETRKIRRQLKYDPYSIVSGLIGRVANNQECQRTDGKEDDLTTADTPTTSDNRVSAPNDRRNDVIVHAAAANVNVEAVKCFEPDETRSRNGEESTRSATSSAATVAASLIVDDFDEILSTIEDEENDCTAANERETNGSITDTSNEEAHNDDGSFSENSVDSSDILSSNGSGLNTSDDNEDSSGHETFSIVGHMEKLFSIIQFKKALTNMFVILVVLAMAVRSKLNYITILNMFRMCKAMTVNCELPLTKTTLWKLLSRNDDATSKRHYYCRICMTDIEVKGKKPTSTCNCQRCGPTKKINDLSYFIHLDIGTQIQQLFENRKIFECLSYRSTREKQETNNMEDIYDGEMYKRLREPGDFLHNEENYSFSLFTDGVKVSNSSNASAWPIMLMINEFSPHARKRYMILAGIWVDKKHPDLQLLLWPIVKELKLLYTDGIGWMNPETNEKTTSRFVTIVCTADSKARAPLLCMTQGNGEYGCTYCYHKGVPLPTPGVVRVYPFQEVPSARRKHHEMYEYMMVADSSNRIFGIQGSPAIALLPEFDLSRGAPVDSMHNVYLGVTKFHTQLLVYGKASDDWYIGSPKNIATINEILLNIRPPSKISRRPRPIEENTQWKASEWKNWIQFYALRCFHGILGQQYHEHLALLSRAVYILNKDSISTHELRSARMMLTNYVRKFEELFGLNNMRFNIHLLIHLADSVQDWGPFWTHSAFPYEAFNKKIVDKVTSGNSRCLQIATRHFLMRFIENSLVDERIPYVTREKVNEILTNGLKKRDYAIELVRTHRQIFEGKGKSMSDRAPLNDELEVLSAFVETQQPPSIVTHYRKAIISCNGSMTYSCESTEKSKTTKYCNKYIHCMRIGYGEIEKIVTFRYDDGSIINGFIVKKMLKRGKYNEMEHVDIVIGGTDAFVVCDDKANIVPAILISTIDEGALISKLPNIWETD